MATAQPKKRVTTIRIIQDAGAASIPKVGQVMGPHGVNIGAIIREFNEKTQAQRGLSVAADVHIYEDRSVAVVPRTPTTSSLIRRAVGLAQGSATPGTHTVARLSQQQVTEVATIKLPDLNTDSLDDARGAVIGSARSMGIAVEPDQ